ncbi:tetratricopeptide repeat protein, partial [Streptomyces mirabilis]
PATLTSRNNLASTHQTAGDRSRAIELYEENLAEAQRILEFEHPKIAEYRTTLAQARAQ